jgi:Glycosyltransferase family 87
MSGGVEHSATPRRPPLWLAGAAVTSAWAALYSVVSWIGTYLLRSPVHEDTLMYYTAAQVGLRHGWSAIYDQALFRSVSPVVARIVDIPAPFASPPLLAWVFVPFTALPEPVAYVLWTLLSVAALVLAWHVAAPYTGLAKLTLLLVAIGLWPVWVSFYLGQPIAILMALVAAGWWFSSNDRPLAAGAALALATMLKPQDVLLVPVALLIAGRYRIVWSWVAGCAAIGLATVIALGPSGLIGWWHAIKVVQGLHLDTDYTLAHLLGTGPLAYLLWALQGATALLVAWWRRRELEIVFAAALLGTAAAASYFHEYDYCVLVLAAWLVLRTSPPLWHRLWLLVGVLTMQLMDYDRDAVQPVTWHTPQLIFDAVWLGILLIYSYRAGRAWLARPDESSLWTALPARESGKAQLPT